MLLVPANKLIFKDAEKARDAITISQSKEIKNLYLEWSQEIAEKAEFYKNKTTYSSGISQIQMGILKKQLKASADDVSRQLNGLIKRNMYLTSNGVVESNQKWLKSLGFKSPITTNFSSVQTLAIENLVTGNIYKTGWSLSKRIWGIEESTLKEAYSIVAKGMAENLPMYDVAKNLEKLVNPNASKPWNLKSPDGKLIYKKKVDYNAQRLGRTLVQHAYQQSFMAVTKNNPLIDAYKWDANGSRVCPLCLSRDGVVYNKSDLPMDHPNGMCVMVPVIGKNIEDRVANWISNPDGYDPDLDDFAKNFGYEKSVKLGFNEFQEKYLKPLGFTPENMPTNFDDFSHKMSTYQGIEILSYMGTDWQNPHPYQVIQKFYNEKLATLSPVNASVGSVSKVVSEANSLQDNLSILVGKYGKSPYKSAKAWMGKLDSNALKEFEIAKNQSGLSWKNFYATHISNKGVVPKSDIKKVEQAVFKAFDSTQGKKWIENVKINEESKMLDIEKSMMSKLSQSQIGGLKTYTGSSYSEMNKYLRYKAIGMSNEAAISNSGISLEKLDKLNEAIQGLSKLSFDNDIYLRRGTDVGDLAGLFMQGDFKENKMALNGKTPEELNQMFQGAVGDYAGFTSTSSLWDRGFSGDVEIVFKVPKGANASSVMSISRFGTGEGETILSPSTKVKCLSVEKSDGHMGSYIRVFLEVLK